MRIDIRATRPEKKARRAEKVDSIKVIVTRPDGTALEFDGDEKSWLRLAVIGLLMEKFGEPPTKWGMANNLPETVTHGEMLEAAIKAIRKMGEVWFI